MFSEIGSEFWNIPVKNEDNYLFSETTQWLLSGRSALQSIIKAQKDCHTVAMPSWCCDSMIKPFLNAGIKVCFYPVYADGGLVQDLSQVEADCVLVMDYFGYTGQVDASEFSGVVIRDVTHSIFSKTYDDANYYFGSLRKWAGFWTGGFGWGFTAEEAYPAEERYIGLRKRAMEEKQQYIAGLSDKKDYLNIFSKAEEYLEQSAAASADPRDVRLAKKLDVEYIKNRRRKNAAMLLDAFSDIAIFPSMEEQDCPLFVPILVPGSKRDALRRYLIDNQIYCPVHWPVSPYHELDKKSKDLYDKELSLVCDQRYAESDMERLIETVKRFWKE